MRALCFATQYESVIVHFLPAMIVLNQIINDTHAGKIHTQIVTEKIYIFRNPVFEQKVKMFYFLESCI